MPAVKCKNCKGQFYAKPSWLDKGWGKYCSLECRHKSQKNGKLVDCFICDKPVYKTQKELEASQSKKYFCSKSCQTMWRNSIVYVGKNHSNWKGGESTYKNILLRSKTPRVCRRCEINDIRLLAVHHIDSNHKNNRLNNLIWLCHNCHFLIHHSDKENREFMEAMV